MLVEKITSLFAWTQRHKILAALAALIIVAAIVVGVRALQLRGERLSEPLRRGSIAESVYGIGTVTATKSFALKLGVTSTIRRLYVEEGATVRRGQQLIELDQVKFSAPFDGTVTALPFKVGETVFAQATILSLVDLRDRYLVVSLEQRGALRVRPRQNARISFDSMRGDTYDGAVEAVYSNDNNFLVRIDVSALPPQILPGMTADVAITIAERRDVLLIPIAALDGGYVYARRAGGRSERIAVKTGVVDAVMAEVIAGDLKEGDRLVLRNSGAP